VVIISPMSSFFVFETLFVAVIDPGEALKPAAGLIPEYIGILEVHVSSNTTEMNTG
jgi:hypothetical protein